MAVATQRPWQRRYTLGIDGHQVRVAKFERVQDRDLALRAVNSHDQLVAALEAARPFLNYIRHGNGWPEVRAQVDAALAAVKGEPS